MAVQSPGPIFNDSTFLRYKVYESPVVEDSPLWKHRHWRMQDDWPWADHYQPAHQTAHQPKFKIVVTFDDTIAVLKKKIMRAQGVKENIQVL